MFYEETPERPPLLLRALLTVPIRTEGDKSHAGARVRCVYERGHLIKRITAVEPANLLQFEVVEQRLGIEDLVITLGGSYKINSSGAGAELVLLTKYKTRLYPRFMWRAVEAFLVSQLHNHVLKGLSAVMSASNQALQTMVAESLTP